MTTTKAAIRRRAVSIARIDGRARGFASRDGGTTALTATGGGALTLIDTAGLPPAGAASTTGKGDWIYRPAQGAADQRRLIASYDAATRTFTVETGTNWSVSPAASDPYLVLKDDPDVWDSALLEALRTLVSSIHYDEFTPTTSGTVRYTVSAAPISQTGIIRASQIDAIDVHDVNETAGQERWVSWDDGYHTWKVYDDEGTVTIDFLDPDRAPSTSDRLRIKWSAQFAAPASESVSIATDEYLAALATCVVMADWLAKPNDPGNDWNNIGRRVRQQYAAQRRLILGQDAYRQVGRTAQQAGAVGVAGRMGRRR